MNVTLNTKCLSVRRRKSSLKFNQTRRLLRIKWSSSNKITRQLETKFIVISKKP